VVRRPGLFTRWSSEIKRSGMFRSGERVGIAVSGGPDSVLLLDFMRRLKCQVGLGLAVVHFNHRLRGAESDADEAFVEGLAHHLNLEFIRGEADVAREARERRRNLEATARDLRYRFFFSLVNQGRLNKVATAHNANDQAETVLLRLLRGTGTRGLAGIYPLLEGKVARPFLNLTRAEIERELREQKLEFRTDSSNADSRFRRNKIRMELLPLLERQYNPRVVRLLSELSDRAREDEACLDQRSREQSRAWRVRAGAEEKIPVRSLLEFPPAISRRVIRQMIQAVRGNLRGMGYSHIEALRQFSLAAQSGQSIFLPGGLRARKDFDWLVIGVEPSGTFEPEFSWRVELPGEVFVPSLGSTFRFEIIESEEGQARYNSRESAGLDLLKLSGDLTLRNWRAGDRFWPLGSRKSWKLKELFQRRRIPWGERRLWPVIHSGNGGDIVWVRGFPPSSRVAASCESKKILRIVENLKSHG
jgi:tRNA(Ile)-lysidine synthase